MSQVYRVSGGVMPRHRITLGLQAVIVLDEGYHKLVSVAQDATSYVMVTLRGGDRDVSGVVELPQVV